MQSKRTEETRRLLIGDLKHRVKNTLASVQAIANQTLRHTQSPADFAAKFTGRIQALARAHSLLSSATWQGANLKELIQDQCQLGTIDEARLTALGPSVELRSEEHTSELQSLMRISYAVFCLTKKKKIPTAT